MRRRGSRWEAGALKALLGEGPAGTRLQIFLECDSLLFVAERDVGLEPPRPEFGGVWYLASVVLR